MTAETKISFQLVLCDVNQDVLSAWTDQFLGTPGVEIVNQDILDVEADALLLPGNSFGFLESGLELRVWETMGAAVQDSLRKRAREEFGGEILIGQAVIERPASPGRPFVYAPLWRTPQDIGATLNVYLSARAAFRALASDSGPPLRRIAIPGMGVDPGGMDPRISARQLRYGYQVGTGRRGGGAKNLTRLIRREKKLKSAPRSASAD